jgi:DinB superfamily
LEHTFGPGLLSFPDLAVHGTADEILADWENSRRPVTAWLASASNTDLLEPRPSHLGGSRTAGEVMTILLDEQIHHGDEIALLRDLYRRFGT